MRKLVLLVLLAASAAFADVGYYIGSFDPPTLGHRDCVLKAMQAHHLDKVYITVNHNTAKDFNASVDERIVMLKLLFRGYKDRIEILREPLEGRVAFAQYLLDKHEGKVLGIFGDDTFEKNFNIFKDVANFDYIKIARPDSTLEAAYEPIIYDLEVDADGLSSSLARERIAQGIDPVDVLDLEVIRYIKKEKLYLPIPEKDLAAAQKAYLARYRAFMQTPHARMPDLDLTGIAEPGFKSTQTLGAQADKFIRHIVEAKRLSVADQLRFRPVAEEILHVPSRSRSRPLRSPLKAGFYPGSFDPMSSAQKEVIERSLRQLGLDRIYVTVLEASRKPISLSLEERVREVKRALSDLGDRVVVLTAPNLDGIPRVARNLSAEHEGGLVAIFGSNVFDANYKRCASVPHLRFAVVPHPDDGSQRSYPDGVAVIHSEGSDPCVAWFKRRQS